MSAERLSGYGHITNVIARGRGIMKVNFGWQSQIIPNRLVTNRLLYSGSAFFLEHRRGACGGRQASLS